MATARQSCEHSAAVGTHDVCRQSGEEARLPDQEEEAGRMQLDGYPESIKWIRKELDVK